MIAALFVETGGCYYNVPGVEPWDFSRDARKYAGPYPVIAHPPCQLWGKLARVNFSRWGGVHNYPGNDGGCFAHALACVRVFGGVLEHPAFSKAWDAYRLQKPTSSGWNECGQNEWVCEVWQSAYGHLANKKTWLFYRGAKPHELNWSKPIGTHQIGAATDVEKNATNRPLTEKRRAQRHYYSETSLCAWRVAVLSKTKQSSDDME